MKPTVGFCVLLSLALAVAALAQDKEQSKEDKALKADLEKLQGKWEFTFRDPDGNVAVRKVKEIKGNTEKVTWFLPNGDVHQINTVDIKLEKSGEDRVFIYSNWKWVEGPEKGKEFKGKVGSFVYKLDGDTWTEILETGDDKIEWKRLKDKK